MRKTFLPTAARAVSSVLILSALAFSCAHAASLGKLTVLSSLGQPLRAEIELTAVSKDEAGSIVAKLASVESFRKANVEFNPALKSLNFSVEKRGGRQFVRVSSGQVMNEPYVDMLLELKSSSGQLVREYTFLLDPPELRTAAAQVVSPSLVPALISPTQVTPLPPLKQAASEPVASEKSVKPPARVTPAKPVSQPAPEKTAKSAKPVKPAAEARVDKSAAEHRVKKGETLAVIAKNNKPEEVSLEQMLVAMYRANPDAFIGNNMNRLKVGKVLSIPDADTAGSVGKSEARKIIVAQAADFTSYRNRLAGAAAQAAPQKAVDAGQVGGGQIGAKITERPTAAAVAQDKLKVSKAEADKGDKSSGKASAEEKLAQDKAAAESQARIKELEKNISDMQAVLQLKNKDLAAQQKQAEKPTAAASVPAAAPAASAPAASVPATPAPTASASGASASVSAATSAPAAAKPSVPAKRKFVPPPPPPPEPGFFDELLDNPMMLGGLGVVVLLLAYILVRRRKKPSQQAIADMPDEGLEPSNSMFGTSGGQSVDTNNSIFNSSFTPSASLLDANEVDPLAEADVYIAYGREAQAIEILKEALRQHSDRNALRVKLLEIYASKKDIHAFDLLASELFSLTKGEGEDWVYVAGIGISIDPGNPLYAGGELSGDMLANSVSLHGSVTRPMEELDPDARLAAPRPHEVAPSGALGAELQISPEQFAMPDLPLDLAPAAGTASSDSLDFAVPVGVASSDALDFNLGDNPVEAQAVVETGKPMDDGLDFVLSEPEAALPDFELKPANPSETPATLGFDLGDLNIDRHEQYAAPGLDVKELGNEAIEYLADFKPSPKAGLQLAPEETTADRVPEIAAEELAETPVYRVAPEFPEIASSNVPDAPQSAPVTSSFDFGSINLDLHQPPSEEPDMMFLAQPEISHPEMSQPEMAQPEMAQLAESVVPAIRANDAEMNTKLDLADAYLGIGDKEGACELLEEVIQEGSGEVVERAKMALAKIS